MKTYRQSNLAIVSALIRTISRKQRRRLDFGRHNGCLKVTKSWALALCGFLLLSITMSASAQDLASKEELYEGKEFANAFADPKDNPDLPNVLLIGDSISNAYTVDVRKLLANKADVFRIPSNGKDASFGSENLDKWLGNRKWDVIHFNWGLWDICYRNPKSKTQGHRDKVNGTLTASPDQYRESMEKIVARLKKTEATLIWCATTPVPEHEAGRKLGDEIKYNAIAASIMSENDILINDLHAHALKRLPEIQIKKGDVHFNSDGSAYLAEQVAQTISAALKNNANDEDRPAQPNIVLLLTDDLGWQDVKCYDIDDPSPYETPNIDALAKKGAMFWQAYSPAPTCAPSRCAIMSGQHPARAQKTHVVGGAPPAPRNVKSQRMMDPWYSGRMPDEEVTLAEVLQTNGYATGHSGKWHMAINHNSFPNAKDQGFDFTRASRGSRSSMQDRLTGFATDKPDDPFRLDANGYPFHQTNDDALTFLKESKDKPFFLYYATWLVHGPIHTRSEAHLKKYADRMGIDPAKTPKKDTPGQQNPFYGSMVQELDYYVGQVFDYLDETEDPRWPGHMLSENTYVIFTSDNGGMEGGPEERYTDNNPLDRGKISAKEGGTRVPLIITGPGIAAGVQSNVMVNGLDFYPTILSLTGITKPENKILDGCDLKPLLLDDATDGSLVADADGSARDSMMWHFPHGVALESTIRVGDYKLIHNYDWRDNPQTEEFELFRLYDSTGEEQQRVDIEESNNLASSMPERTREMAAKLKSELTQMQASYPYYNPGYRGEMPHKDRVCSVKSHQQDGTLVTFQYEATDKSKVVRADLIYTLNGNKRDEEWFRAFATLGPDGKVTAEIPSGATHYFLNLIDENQFLRSYPEPVNKKKSFAGSAIPVRD